MIARALPFACATLALVAGASASAAPAGKTFTYVCQHGERVTVRYLGKEASAIQLRLKGNTVRLERRPSSAGEQYADDVLRMAWYAQRNQGFLEVGGQVVVDQCKLKR